LPFFNVILTLNASHQNSNAGIFGDFGYVIEHEILSRMVKKKFHELIFATPFANIPVLSESGTQLAASL
jgi:hypothetical protein